jgi:hypothetical protein
MLIPLEGQHVTGNQEGSTNVKKPRTWRQYMNRYVYSQMWPVRVRDVALTLCRRGGFNRPLDKIK